MRRHEYRIDEPVGLAISSLHRMAVVTMDVEGSWQQVGAIADLAACFARHGLSLDSIASSQTRVTVSLDPSANTLDADTLGALMEDLAELSQPRLISPVSSVSIVGTPICAACSTTCPRSSASSRSRRSTCWPTPPTTTASPSWSTRSAPTSSSAPSTTT